MCARLRTPVAVGLAGSAMLGLSFMLVGPAVAQNPGPGGQVPMPLHVQATATPTGAVVVWQLITQAQSYAVNRWKQVDAHTRCCDKHVQHVTGLRYVDEPLPGPGRYLYRVVVHLPGGVRGFEQAALDVPAPAPAATGRPAGDPSTATLVNPDRPGDIAMRRPPGGAAPPEASGSSQLDPTKPSTGMADPAGGQGGTGSSQGGTTPTPPVRSRTAYHSLPVTITNTAGGAAPAVTSGHYLVTVTGLRSGWATTDDMFHGDGKGDEVFAAAYIRRYNRQTAEVLETTNRQTAVYGDTWRRTTERNQGGSLTPSGGIGDNDSIPGDAPVARALPAQESAFPWKLWEGTLTDGADALVISPSIWEYDGQPGLFYNWAANQAALSSTLFLSQRLQDQIASRAFAPLALGVTEGASTQFTQAGRSAANVVIAAALGIPPGLNFVGGEDRPIGMVGPTLPNTTVVLTREIVEAALAAPPLGLVLPMPPMQIRVPKPGIMVINFQDQGSSFSTDRKAFYSMILQVERLP